MGNASVGIDGTHDYNSFSGSSNEGEPNGQANVSTSIFTNYAGGDFTLSTATASGLTLSSPYNLDPLGNIRGADGVFDRGAFEFVSGGPTPSATPTT